MNILIVSTNKYPDGDAGAVRQHALAQLLRAFGQVFLIGLGEETGFQMKQHEGIRYVSFRSGRRGLVGRLANIINFKKRLSAFVKNSELRFDVVLVVDVPVHALLYIKRLARLNGIMLMHDAVEWYSPTQFKLGRFSPPYIMKDAYNRVFVDQKFRVVAISQYLERHFQSRGCVTVRIPAIMDVMSMNWEKRISQGRLVLVYAGSPGAKDRLREIVLGLSLLEPEELQKVELRILGINAEQAAALLGKGVLPSLGRQVLILGRVSRNVVLQNLAEADFTVLIRPEDKRYAQAGFPSKVVESMASATPVICNLTSDLHMYILDGINGIVIDDSSPTSFCSGVRKALRLTLEERRVMCANSRRTAEDYFDYRSYRYQMEQMIQGVSHEDTSG